MKETMKDIILNASADMTESCHKTDFIVSRGERCLPDRSCIIRILKDLKRVMFPGYFGEENIALISPQYFIGDRLTDIYGKLKPQIEISLYYRDYEKYTEEEHYELLRYIDHRANTSGHINIKVYGQENIPDDNGFMFYPNHQGLYDVLAIMEACPRPFSVVAKKEVANVPFLKQVFACMKAYMIDREDVRQSLQVIINVSNDVKAGKNFLIFPEGTRSKKGNQVQEFKGGSFKAATRAKCPIVPVALVNCFVPFDSKTTEQVDVQVHFLKPLFYDEYKDMKTTEIAAIVKERIQCTINSSL